MINLASIDTTIKQQRGRWCWAACVQVVMKFRGVQHSQDELAEMVPRLDSRRAGTRLPETWNVGITEHEITRLFHRLGVTSVERTGPLPAAALNAALTQGPVAVAFAWGHMCLVYGRQENDYLMYDPLGPASGRISLDGIRNYGQGKNTWDTSWIGL